MCFSATASFAAAAVTIAAGLAAISRTQSARELPLAAMPLLFGLQQSIEGGLWLTLPIAPEGAISSALTYAFLVFALLVWPVYAPLSAFLVEAHRARRLLIAVCLLLGIASAAHSAWAVLGAQYSARITEHGIVYGGNESFPIVALYLAAATFGLLLSSRLAVSALGLIVLSGSLASYYFFANSFISVWCFFAATASVVIFWHFQHAHAARRAAPAA